MTDRELRKVWDLERRLEKRAHWRRVRWFLGGLLAGCLAWWGIVEAGVWLGARLRGWL